MKTIEIGTQEFTFDPNNKDVNRYLNAVSNDDKVTPSFNFLMQVVEPSQKDALKAMLLDDENTPNGLVVMKITGILVDEIGGDLAVTVKK